MTEGALIGGGLFGRRGEGRRHEDDMRPTRGSSGVRAAIWAPPREKPIRSMVGAPSARSHAIQAATSHRAASA